jgi:hypothetical protein
MPSIACIRMASKSDACGGNEACSARMLKPRPPCAERRSGGDDLGGKQTWRSEHKGISAASKTTRHKVVYAGEAGSRPNDFLGKADDTKEETGKRTSWDRRGRGSGIQRKILRITSGKSQGQQGLVITGKDSSNEARNRRRGEPSGIGA